MKKALGVCSLILKMIRYVQVLVLSAIALFNDCLHKDVFVSLLSQICGLVI